MPKRSVEFSREARKSEPFLSMYLETFVRPRPALMRLVRSRNEVELGTYAVSVTALTYLVSTFLGYLGRLDQRAYEDAMSTPGNPAHQLIWSLMAAYAIGFLTLFFLGAKAGHGLSGWRAFLPALTGPTATLPVLRSTRSRSPSASTSKSSNSLGMTISANWEPRKSKLARESSDSGGATPIRSSRAGRSATLFDRTLGFGELRAAKTSRSRAT